MTKLEMQFLDTEATEVGRVNSNQNVWLAYYLCGSSDWLHLIVIQNNGCREFIHARHIITKGLFLTTFHIEIGSAFFINSRISVSSLIISPVSESVSIFLCLNISSNNRLLCTRLLLLSVFLLSEDFNDPSWMTFKLAIWSKVFLSFKRSVCTVIHCIWP